jgi:hypothetical protein
MEQKTLNDFSEFVRINGAVESLRLERLEVSTRIQEIDLELSKPKQAEIDGQQAWTMILEHASEVRTRYSADARSELRQQQIELEARLQFLNDALSVGEIELDAVRGRLSVELCQQVREEWVSEIRRILQALKEISQANEALDRIRHQLEADGIRTGALPYSKFNFAGSWNDPLGGKVLGYQIEVAENFPELARDADRQVKILRARLIERERKFAAREEVQDHD